MHRPIDSNFEKEKNKEKEDLLNKEIKKLKEENKEMKKYIYL